MPFISIELSKLREDVAGLAAENERALAACAGHEFVAINARVRNSHHRCRACGGVVDYLTAAA